MVDRFGRWTPEDNYDNYPKNKWCDMDRVANFIKEQNYIPKTSLENLTYMIISHFEGETEDENSSYCPMYDNNGNLNMSSLIDFVKASAIQEFDYEC